MSGAAVGLETGPAGLAGRRRTTAAVAERPLPFVAELGLFALIAAFSMGLWARLVEPSSADRQALALLVVAAGAVALHRLARVRSRGARRTGCIAVAVATVIGALVAAGSPAPPARPRPVGRAADADPGRHGRDRAGRAALRRVGPVDPAHPGARRPGAGGACRDDRLLAGPPARPAGRRRWRCC